MRVLIRVMFVALAVTLAVGPLAAASMPLATGAHVSAAPTSTHSATRGILGVVGMLGGVAVGITVKDTASIAQKFVTRASAAAGDYKAGVQGAGSAWEAGARAGEGNYAQGVQQAITDGRYGKGVNGSAGKYEKNAVALGSTRYAPGVQNAQGAFAAGFGPYADKLKSLVLPPKGPRRSPQNQARANFVATELGKMKEGK